MGEDLVRLRLGSAVVLWGVGLLTAPAVAQADTITPMFFDNFESETPDILNSSLNNWFVTSGAIDVLGPGNLCGPAGNFSQCVDLDGSAGSAGTIQSKTTFSLDPGDYRLSFDLAGANRTWRGSEVNTVSVSLGGFFLEDFTLFQFDPFQTFTRDISVPEAAFANIVFQHQGADWIGLLLDNVSLSHVVFDEIEVPEEPNVVETPEPGTLLLLGTALSVLAYRFRKSQ